MAVMERRRIREDEQVRTLGMTSPWRLLRVPLFRNLLIADLVSDIGTFVQAVAASWLMVSFGAGPMYVALTQSASSLPFFLLALPAGALGDIVDRRSLVLYTEIWMFVVAAVLAAVTIAGMMSPWLLLLLTFALSAGDAIEAPTWRAIIPSIVGRKDLAPATALNGIEFNLARAIGPGLGGILVAVAGVGAAFALNALTFLVAITVIARWTPHRKRRSTPSEHLGGATTAAIRYVLYSPDIRALLVRVGSVVFFASALLALLPSVASESRSGAIGYGVLLGLFGTGAVCGALFMQPVRAWMSTEMLVSAATLAVGATVVVTGMTRDFRVLSTAMFAGGAAWLLFTSMLSSLAQLVTPEWVRSRVLAVYLLVFQGSLAAGSALWGAMAQHTSVRGALLIAGLGTLATALLGRYVRLSDVVGDPTIWNHWRLPSVMPASEPRADAGPVLVTVEYLIKPDQKAEFVSAIHRFERVRRRDGAVQWGVFYDSETAGRYLETFLVPSWAEHLRQHDRFTLADRELEARVTSTLRGEPKATHFVFATTRDPG
jgi:MFS family permease